MSSEGSSLPTLGEFVNAFRARGGYVNTEIHSDENGNPYIILIMKSSLGAWVMVARPDLEEILTRSVMDNYVRRLGLRRYIPLPLDDETTPPISEEEPDK